MEYHSRCRKVTHTFILKKNYQNCYNTSIFTTSNTFDDKQQRKRVYSALVSTHIVSLIYKNGPAKTNIVRQRPGTAAGVRRSLPRAVKVSAPRVSRYSPPHHLHRPRPRSPHARATHTPATPANGGCDALGRRGNKNNAESQ